MDYNHVDCTPFLLDALTPTPSLPSRHNAAGGRGTAAHTSRQDWTGHWTVAEDTKQYQATSVCAVLTH